MDNYQSGFWYDISLDRFFCRNKEIAINNIEHPLTICIHIGYKCNLLCPYCSSKRELNEVDGDYLCEQIVNFIVKQHVKRVVISGGEPFLYENRLIPILALLRKENIVTLVSTNGTLIKDCSDELIDLIDWIDVSLPATNRELYYQIRGADCFDKVISNLNMLSTKNKHIRVSYSLNSYNREDVYNLPVLLKLLNINNIRISHTYYENGDYQNYNPIISKHLLLLFEKEYKNERFTLYLPLSKEKVEAYQKGYLVIKANGDMYHFNTLPSNRLFSITDYCDDYKQAIKSISRNQARLFLKELQE